MVFLEFPSQFTPCKWNTWWRPFAYCLRMFNDAHASMSNTLNSQFSTEEGWVTCAFVSMIVIICMHADVRTDGCVWFAVLLHLCFLKASAIWHSRICQQKTSNDIYVYQCCKMVPSLWLPDAAGLTVYPCTRVGGIWIVYIYIYLYSIHISYTCTVMSQRPVMPSCIIVEAFTH